MAQLVLTMLFRLYKGLLNLGIPRPSMDSKHDRVLKTYLFAFFREKTIRLDLVARPSKYCEKLLFYLRVIEIGLGIL